MSDLRGADLTCRHSRWDCIPFHPTTPERSDVWSPTGGARIVLSEPENKQGKRVHLRLRTKRVVWLKIPNYHVKTNPQHSTHSSPTTHTPELAYKHTLAPHFLSSQILDVLLTSSGFPAPTTINFPSSSPTKMWLHSFVTETLLTGTFKASGATGASRLLKTEQSVNRTL